jgi:hypothetical protein
LLVGESGQLTRASFTGSAIYSFFHLLVVGSLIGFVAYNWLITRVSAALAGTYAYVNPIVAILVGWLVNDEQITTRILSGMGVILAGVALVRSGANRTLAAPVRMRESGKSTGQNDHCAETSPVVKAETPPSEQAFRECRAPSQSP